MRLEYDNSIPANTLPLVMVNKQAEKRVEIHIRTDANGGAILLACMGSDSKLPERTLQQGPYQLSAQAVAAKKAIAGELKKKGYMVRLDLHTIWLLQIQKDYNNIQTTKLLTKGDYQFNPKDVFLDW